MSDKLNVIFYPSFNSEFEIQAELYKELSEMRIDVRGEVSALCYDNGRHKVYFDLVVFKNQKPICIIETKNSLNNNSIKLSNGRQKRRYEKFNIPILCCRNLSQVDKIINKIEKLLCLT